MPAMMCATTGTGNDVNRSAGGMRAGPPLSWVRRSEPEMIGISESRISASGMSHTPLTGRGAVEGVVTMGWLARSTAPPPGDERPDRPDRVPRGEQADRFGQLVGERAG